MFNFQHGWFLLKLKHAVQTIFRSALRLSVRLFDFFNFPVSIGDHAFITAFRTKQWKILQHGIFPHLRPGFAAAFRTAEPIRFSNFIHKKSLPHSSFVSSLRRRLRSFSFTSAAFRMHCPKSTRCQTIFAARIKAA